MDTFDGKLAVVTGGGSGMGRELVVQLASEGCSVAACDLTVHALDDTVRRANERSPAGVAITAHECDVSDERAVERFRDEVLARHDTDHVELLFNNAGIAGGGSFITEDRAVWDRTFGVCWGGVYHCTRAFLPLLIASDRACLVNTSSVNGFWASLGPGIPHTAYSAAKFAVKGFTEALMEDCRVNAPHVQVAVVMPGHIGTDIVLNSRRAHAGSSDATPRPDELAAMRAGAARWGLDADELSDAELTQMIDVMAHAFRDTAPMSAAEAATVILDGVRSGTWRILIGDDARALDEAVRADPERVYGPGGLRLASILGPDGPA
jgi:NAD(P)-dependent dehydrogenase (short-subunit alcohol dehydrogenase family)